MSIVKSRSRSLCVEKTGVFNRMIFRYTMIEQVNTRDSGGRKISDSVQMIVLQDHGASIQIEVDGFDRSDLQQIEFWLKEKRILKEDDVLLKYEDIQEWERGGAETYLSIFRIRYITTGELYIDKTLVVKSIVSMFPDARLLAWKRRREILAKNGVPVSHWYWCGDGVIIEDFYPRGIQLNNISDLNNISKIKDILEDIGFSPLHISDDVRFDEDGNPYYVDFGFDLGGGGG